MMIVLRSLLLVLLGSSYAFASSAERKLRSVPVAATTTIQVPLLYTLSMTIRDAEPRAAMLCWMTPTLVLVTVVLLALMVYNCHQR